MIVNGEAFSRRLESYSDDTIRLISKCMRYRESGVKAIEIISSTDTEEEVVRRLKALKAEYETTISMKKP